MKRLLRFLYQYNALFVFLILQFVSLYLLFNFNRTHKVKYLTAVYNASKSYNEFISSIRNYFLLKEENKRLLKAYSELQKDNIKLKQYIEQSKNLIPKTSKLIVQIDSPKVSYKYIPARVITNEVRSKLNYFIINKGANDGVKENVGIVSSDGIVGITKGVSEEFSSCVSILNSNVLVSVKVLKNNILGTLSWDGEDLSVATIKYIPVHYNVQKGDKVVTSGLDNVFPPNILVGEVVTVEPDRNEIGFVKLKVKLSADFYKLNHVFVVINTHKKEIDSLQNDIKALYK